MNQILLPGLNKQLKFLFEKINVDNLQSLVLGSQSVGIAKALSDKTGRNVDLIVEDYETLMTANIELDKSKNIKIKLMDFERTDFTQEQFDLIFSQASITNPNRKKIIKELKRILKQDGILCVGETVQLSKEVPPFIKDVFNASGLDPLFVDDMKKYYTDRNFDLIDSIDLSNTLNKFYSDYITILKNKSKKLSVSEKSFYKKILNKIKHESNTYLKLGGKKYIGFKVLLLKKSSK